MMPIVSRPEAIAQIATQIREGESLLARDVVAEEELRQLKGDADAWLHEIETMVRTIAGSDEEASHFILPRAAPPSTSTPFTLRLRREKGTINEYIRRLEGFGRKVQIGASGMVSKKVFIVHGHDQKVKFEVAHFISQNKLEPCILDEQPGLSLALIQKFEKQASDAAFAIVLLTPDDLGGKKSDPPVLRPRARQNVIFELGYLYAKLTREKVCALLVGDLEFPSDINGVSYIQYDEHGGWHWKLAREMKEAGLALEL